MQEGRQLLRALEHVELQRLEVRAAEAGGRGRSTPSPAAPDAPLLWKAEVFRRASFADDRFYDAHGAACSPSLHARRCAYCASSLLLRRACGGDEPEALVRTFSTDNLPKTVPTLLYTYSAMSSCRPPVSCSRSRPLTFSRLPPARIDCAKCA